MSVALSKVWDINFPTLLLQSPLDRTPVFHRFTPLYSWFPFYIWAQWEHENHVKSLSRELNIGPGCSNHQKIILCIYRTFNVDRSSKSRSSFNSTNNTGSSTHICSHLVHICWWLDGNATTKMTQLNSKSQLRSTYEMCYDHNETWHHLKQGSKTKK